MPGERSGTVSGPGALPAAVLWDMDGLLIDSEPIWYAVEQEVMTRLGGPWGPEQQAQLVGAPIEHTVALLLETARSDVDPAVVRAWMFDGMVSSITQGVRILPGAADLLTALSAAGVPSVLVSSSFRVLVDAVLATIAPLDAMFAATVAGDEVSARKPDPAPYLRAAELAGVPIGSCLVLEDSATGARSGTAAGAPVIVVPSVVDVSPASGHLRYDSLAQVDLDALRHALGAHPTPPAVMAGERPTP